MKKKINQQNKKKFDKDNILTKKLLKLKDFELSSLNYQEALKKDHRNFCQYYGYLLKYNHPLSILNFLYFLY